MKEAEPYFYEEERLKELKSLEIMDTPEEVHYNQIIQMASEICDTPVALISLVDDKRQWFKAKCGLDIKETAKKYSICSHALHAPGVPFIVTDTRKDDRFFDNPLIIGETNIRFYAGFPLITDEGMPLGSLCVIDHQPRELTIKQLSLLEKLANTTVKLIMYEREIKKKA